MGSLNDLHQEAMRLAEQAFLARQRDELAMARSFAFSAYLLEKQAAEHWTVFQEKCTRRTWEMQKDWTDLLDSLRWIEGRGISGEPARF